MAIMVYSLLWVMQIYIINRNKYFGLRVVPTWVLGIWVDGPVGEPLIRSLKPPDKRRRP